MRIVLFPPCVALLAAVLGAAAVPASAADGARAEAAPADAALELPLPAGFRRIDVLPSEAGPGISAFDHPHRIVYAPGADDDTLLVFLVGTSDKPVAGPQEFFRTALEQGYRLVSLSYISYPAVSQICVEQRAAVDPACAERFRQRRIYGDNAFDAIPDQPGDAIVPRLTRLLAHLADVDPEGRWDRYLVEGRPDWTRIAVSGQSQGGGMAQYLGKKERLARVLSFSGGWDQVTQDGVAPWYGSPASTPVDRWYYAYHVQEPAAAKLQRIARTLGLPEGHVFALSAPLGARARASRQPGHGSAISESQYRDVWLRMLGSGQD